MKEIKDLLEKIDEKTLQHVSEPRKRLVKFLKTFYITSEEEG